VKRGAQRWSFVRSLAASLAIAIVASGSTGACDSGPPVTSASGMRIGSVSYEERFPLSNDVHDVTLHGDRLRRAVEMMDKTGVMALEGDFAATGVLDKSTLVVIVKTDRRS
jgi:hypothetical protein